MKLFNKFVGTLSSIFSFVNYPTLYTFFCKGSKIKIIFFLNISSNSTPLMFQSSLTNNFHQKVQVSEIFLRQTFYYAPSPAEQSEHFMHFIFRHIQICTTLLQGELFKVTMYTAHISSAKLGSWCTGHIRSVNWGMDRQSKWLLCTLNILHI